MSHQKLKLSFHFGLSFLLLLIACAGPQEADDTIELEPNAVIQDILVSSNADRSSPKPLDTNWVSGKIYAFTKITIGLRGVDFYLDDPAGEEAPYSQERYAPYDLAGGANSAANPFDTGTLENGIHTLSAQFFLADGGSRAVTTTFLVDNGGNLHNQLLVSDSPQRTGASKLNGSQLAGDAYIFLIPGNSARNIAFYLDGTLRQTERIPFYDAAGTDNDGSAWALDTTTLTNGQHVFKAVISSSSGRQEVTASFSVNNGSEPPPPSAVNVSFDLKEAAGVGAWQFPSHAVVPLPYGRVQNVSGLSLKDSSGRAVPAQFSVLNRWWARDNSVRHVLVQFLGNAPSLSGARYTLSGGSSPRPSDPITVQDGSMLTVKNSQLELSIQKNPFKLTLPTGELSALLRDENGTLRPTFERNDITIEIEERGPIRSVIKVSAPTLWQNNTVLHGWALRLYAYAGQPFVKLDFQVQNSAKNTVLSSPLYMQSLTLQVPTNYSGATQQRRALLTETALNNPPVGSLAAGNVGAAIRNFYETFPNGIKVENGTLSVELFPDWSEQFVADGSDTYLKPSGTGLYWLEDMQHVYKEVILDLSGKSQSELEGLAKTFQHPPVAALPLEWYRQTEATLDLGDLLSEEAAASSQNSSRVPDYPLSTKRFYQNDYRSDFFLGWDEFLMFPVRKRDPRTTGGWPDVNTEFLLTGNPKDYYLANHRVLGELNVMPEWLPGYSYDRDQATLRLTENPYRGPSWRKFDGHGAPYLRRNYLPGTSQYGRPRDDQHGWFYHVEQNYYLSANPWIKDWYDFVAEFRKVRLNQGDPFPDMSARAVGHSLNHALQAYRVTGDEDLLQLMDAYIDRELTPRLNNLGAYDAGAGTGAVFQLGFLTRTLIDYLYELPGGEVTTRDAEAFDFIKRSVEWNVNIGNFAYNIPITEARSDFVSSGTGLSMVDPQAWYYLVTDWEPAKTHLLSFMNEGINGGMRPYGEVRAWTGTYEGRLGEIIVKGR